MTEQEAIKALGHEDDAIGYERQLYFEGKFMSARDFRDEQLYFLSRHRAHNRLLHGWGVICGLSVSGLEQDDCRDRWIRIGPGAAIDCYGRELLLEKEWCGELPDQKTLETWLKRGLDSKLGVDLVAFPERRTSDAPQPQPKSKKHAPDQMLEEEGADDEESGQGGTFQVEYLIALAYDEEKIEKVPALVDSECGPADPEFNRVRETVRVVVVRRDTLPHCWSAKGHAGHGEPPCRDDCDEDQPGPGGSCLNPDCPCGRIVPLALVRARIYKDDKLVDKLVDDFCLINERQADREEQATGQRPVVTIETQGRRRLPTPPSFLTHIVKINWPHGGTLDLSELQAGGRLDGRLEITFDRDIQPADTYERRPEDLYDPETSEVNGINRFTLRVTYATPDARVEKEVNFHPRAGLDPHDRRKAVFYIDPQSWGADEEDERLPAGNVFIRLLGDFVLDCHGNPIDANHVGGLLPSGNGSPGGTFESWFRLKHEYYHEPRPQKQARASF